MSDFAKIRAYTAADALWGDAGPDAADVFSEAAVVARDVGVDLRLPAVETHETERTRATPGCDWPWRSAYVTHDSKVQPCCMIMGTQRAVLGDISRDDFASVWANERYRRFRERLLGDEPPEVCRGCSMYPDVF